MNAIFSKAALLAGACLLGACAPTNPPLYYWGGYQPALYQHHKEGMTDYAAQIDAIVATLQRAEALGQSVPPGLHAHLGMLYFNTGREIEAREQFGLEKQLFPESGHFVNYVMKAQPEVSQ
ncbi:MAG TPA: DUF4810 domain-containing protein [Pseudomonas xinjiangensis]|uniref:DUF4810 domain-containing protein n=2 Tax=root TaxID=1 RepID=A0A7V1BM53_9GAMM|nr:DUF4810 domain-containing protein [Halopseudomonas xinjiangensis]HEC47664.1 DUF4810 domain-containing protein [Halopseudomonas xinjiangensis]